MTKKKWYVVTVGKAPGIYTSWTQVAPLVYNVPGGVHQSFSTLEEAQFYYELAINPHAPQRRSSDSSLASSDRDSALETFAPDVRAALSYAAHSATSPRAKSSQARVSSKIRPKVENEREASVDARATVKRSASVHAQRMTAASASHSGTAGISSARHVAARVHTSTFSTSNSKVSLPITGVTYVVPSDGGRPLPAVQAEAVRERRRAAKMKAEAARREREQSQGGIRISAIHESPVRTPSGIRVSRWRAASPTSTSSSPETEVTQREPMDPGTPRSPPTPVRRGGNGVDVQPTLGFQSPTMMSSKSVKNLQASPKQTHLTPRHASVCTPDSVASYPDDEDGDGMIQETTTPGEVTVSKSAGTLSPQPSMLHHNSSTPCDCKICPHGHVLSKYISPPPCSCQVCGHGNILSRNNPPQCSCRLCPHGQLLSASEDNEIIPSAQSAMTAASFGLVQPAHRSNVILKTVSDPRSPMADSAGVPLRLSEAHMFGRPSPANPMLFEPEPGRSVLLG